MTDDATASDHRKICMQLLRQQERALQMLEELRTDMAAPVTRTLLSHLRTDTSCQVEEGVDDVLAKLEDAVRAVQYCKSELQRELEGSHGRPQVGGPPNLPPEMRRFLAERRDSAGFTYDLRQDPIRGWIIRWKEYSEAGVVRGSGQFYERPYAWLER